MLSAWLPTGSSFVHAQGKATIDAEVLVVLAKEEPGTIDPELAKMPGLRRPPFDSYRSMKVLSRPKHKVEVGVPLDLDLPNGRRLRLVLQRQLPDGRYRAQVSINRPDRRDYLPLLTVVASAGDPFFVAGQAYQGGTLIVGVRLGAGP